MPTEAEFRQLAANLRQTAEDLGAECGDLERERDYLRLESPTIRLVIDAAYSESVGQLKALAGTAGSIADEFDKRADVCQEYAEWEEFYNGMWEKFYNGEIDVRPQYRPRPAPWVDT